MRECRIAMGGGGGEEFHSDSKCKLVVKDGGWRSRSRRQAVKRGGGTEERKVYAMV